VSLVRPVEGERRVAALVPRELSDYLPRRLLVAQRRLGAVVVACAGGALAVPYERDALAGYSNSPRVTAVVLAVVAGLFAFGLERIERWLVERPQPFTEPDLVAADDAIRSQSMHSLAGSGLAVELVCLAGVLGALTRSDVQLFRWTLWVPALLCFGGAVWACLYYGHRAWRVRRALPWAAQS
jgi:integrase